MREIELEKWLLALKNEYGNDFLDYAKGRSNANQMLRDLLNLHWKNLHGPFARKGEGYQTPPLSHLDSPVNRNKALQIVYQFLAWKRISSNHVRAKELALEECHERHMDGLIPRLHKQIVRDQSLKEKDGLETRFRRFTCDYILQSNKMRAESPDWPTIFQGAYRSMKSLCLLYSLKFATGARELEIVANEEPGTHWPDSVSSLLHNADLFLKQDQLAAYFIQLLDFQDFPRERTLEELEEKLKAASTFDTIHKDELNDGFKTLINHYVRSFTKTGSTNIKRLIELIEVRLKLELFLVKGKIPPRELKNVISTFVRHKKIKLAEAFFQKYEYKILNDPSNFARLYNGGVIDFATGNFEDAGRKFMQQFARAAPNYLKRDARLYAERTFAELKLKNEGKEPVLFPGTEEARRIFFSNERQKDLRPDQRKYFQAISNLLSKYHRGWEYPKGNRHRIWGKLAEKVMLLEDEAMRSWFTDLLDRSKPYQ